MTEKKEKISKTILLSVLGVLALSACGSVFSSLSKNNSDQARREDALNALDDQNFVKAESIMKTMWEKDKSDENARLYSLALVGQAGLDLFSLVEKIMKNSGSSSGQGSVLNQLSQFLPTDISKTQLTQLTQAIAVLDAAPGAKTTSLGAQRCITAGVYAAQSLNSIQQQATALSSQLAALPSQLAVSGGTCGASNETIQEVGNTLTASIQAAGELNGKFNDAMEILADCLPQGAAGDVTTLTSQVNGILAKADKGCELPSAIGSVTLPGCMSTYITATSANALAGDKKIDGCEIFIHCGSGSCF